MKKKNILLLSVLLFIPVIILTIGFLSVKKDSPVTLTLWHNYGGQLKNKMDEIIEEFNATVGAKKGVIISVTSISGSEALHEKLSMAANGDPGAPVLPDITTAYPKTALILEEKGLLVNLEELFNEKELSAYIPRFLEEGRISNNSLYVFPTAKSTEVLFLNKTVFNRFADATGASLDDLSTFEGLQKTAEKYYEWTDSQTPDIKGDGKTFYVADSLFNYTLIGCKQLGVDLIKDNSLNLSDPTVKKVWDSYFIPAVKGQYAVFDGYASDLAKTGEIVCSTGSTAGISFFAPTVTYADNTTETAQLLILPYPVFEGGERVALQRGAGMSIIKSDKKKEKLAAIFLKWFTSPKINLRFVSSTGYLPVTEEAFGDMMLNEINSITDEKNKNLLRVSREMQMQYDFQTAPLFEGIDELINKYDKGLKTLASEIKDKTSAADQNGNHHTDLDTQENYNTFSKSFK